MITTKIVFDHRGRAGQGDGPVEIRVTVNRKSYYINTLVKCSARHFRDGVIRNCAGAEGLTERVNIIRDKVERIVNDMLDRSVPIDAAVIRRMVSDETQPAGVRTRAFINWCEDQLPKLNVREGTAKHYATLLRRMDEYGKLSSWEHLTVENLCEWDAWLHGLKNGSEPISDSGVWNYHKNLKRLLNRALLFGLIPTNPYDRLRGKFKRGVRENTEYLTEDEMRRFCKLKVQDGVLGKAHDLFVFQMYTGMSYSDAIGFDLSEYKQVDGRWMNVARRVKTGVAYVSELLPPVVDVLERNGWCVPKLDNADYNHALKILGQAAGIATPLHSHLARHTFATWMLRNGAKIENVSRMLGHTNITQTQRYAKVMAQSVHEDFEKVLSKFKKDDEEKS